VQLGDAPRLLPYVVLLALFASAATGAYLMPEPVRERRSLRLRPQRPGVPPAARRPFVLAALAVLSSWSIGALFFSLGPQLAGQIFGTTDALVTGSGMVTLAAAAVVAQLLTGRIAPWIATGAGSIALAVGIALIVVAAATGSGTTLLAGSVLGGFGFGAAFLGGLRALVAKIPPEHRAAVMSAFYVVAYGSLSVPAILAGIVDSTLSLQATFEIFGSIVAAIGLVVAFEAWRTRPVTSARPAKRRDVLLGPTS
jgi:MFS family permease